MRRVLGFLLMASVLQLTAFDVLTECGRHAEAAALGAAETSGAEHEHHGAISQFADAGSRSELPESGDTDTKSLPECCVVTSTCPGSTLAAGSVSRVARLHAVAAKWIPALSAPRSVLLAPEPPPPKA